MPRFAANLTMLFTEDSFLDRFSRAKSAGFDAVEFLFPYAFPAEEIKAKLDQCELKLVLHNMPPGDWVGGERGIACLPDRVDEFRAGVAKSVEYANTLGVMQLNCLAGVAPSDVNPEILRKTFLSNLKYAAMELRKTNIKLLIEPINTFDIPHFFLSGTQQAIEILDELNVDNAFLQYDLYHAQRMEGELANTLTQNLKRIAHIQLADNPGRHEPGTGEINFHYLFQLLDTIGYAGWVGCEYRPASNTAAGLSWIEPYLLGAQ